MSGSLSGIVLVLVSTTLEGFAQVSLKLSTRPGTSKRLWLTLGVIAFFTEAITWTGALRLLDVSVAFPMGSLSFVNVTILSCLLLKERVARSRWLGVAFIIAGVALLGWHA